ncbi:DNA translocase FtsK [Oscillospiraceae bacterium CM]|nr:DNA translocase FtsK [Oscillospiraceae bacterium CM]
MLLKGLFGWGYLAAPPVLFLCAVILAFHRGEPVRFRVISALLLLMTTGALAHLFLNKTYYPVSFAMVHSLWDAGNDLKSGGAVGGSLSVILTYLFSMFGSAVIFISMTAFFLMVALNKTVSDIADAFRAFYNRLKEDAYDDAADEPEQTAQPILPVTSRAQRRMIDIPLDDPKPRGTASVFRSKKHAPLFDQNAGVQPPDMVLGGLAAANQPLAKRTQTGDVPFDIPFMETKTDSKTDIADQTPPARMEPAKSAQPFGDTAKAGSGSYNYPPLNLLAAGSPAGRVDGSEEVRLNVERLVAAFKSFGVNVRITGYTRGPTVTRYEAELEAGVKLNRLTSLADDIALSLGASGVRIAAMPNKISTVGIEVPNKLVSKVFLRDIIDSPTFKNAPSKLTFAIGKNIGGEAIVGDIARLPHMLVAGTTGSGKSVCLNSLILSILYKSTPDEVRFIMIDPKMVEFRVYNGIPHLLVPVVTDVKKASGALQWAVVEMMKRYKLFSEANARDLDGYNKIMRKSEDGAALPQVIVVIDELADLMLTAAKEVEESICRVAQMGRAAGVHLVIATQSPRADVITGLMKANIPSRIALKVSSALESRIILDAGGNADKLVGNGDMLYAPIGSAKPVRIQGTWVSDAEREEVVEFIKKSAQPNYSEEVIRQIDKAAEEKSDSKGDGDAASGVDYDELLPQAVDVIFESGQASVSMLQRRLKLGYSRAARIVDQMEQMNIVGPFEGSKPRPLLITRQQWREMQYIQGTAPTGPELGIRDDYSSPPDDAPF